MIQGAKICNFECVSVFTNDYIQNYNEMYQFGNMFSTKQLTPGIYHDSIVIFQSCTFENCSDNANIT